MGIIVVDNICWAKMAEIIRSSKMSEKIKAEVKSKGFLSILKKDYHKIRMIGQLTIEWFENHEFFLYLTIVKNVKIHLKL